MAKFWAFDVRTGADISLESEGKIEIKMLEDWEGKGDRFALIKKIFAPSRCRNIKEVTKHWQAEQIISGEPTYKSGIPMFQTCSYGNFYK